ncbi:MAG: glycosyltransferase family 2 protein [Chthoniobacteraceae bacterium]
MSGPRFTIITATFNRAPLLREAIASVEAQRRDDIEHLIIDGASTDGTRELLAAHPKLRVVSEPDHGIYDAFNKGLALARGEIVHFLNSDDLLVPGALDAVDRAFGDEVDVVSGGVEFFDRDVTGAERVLRRESDLAFSLSAVLRGVPAINARFFRRSFAERVGSFDPGYRIVADRDFLLRAAVLHPRSVALPMVVYRYRSHAGSLTVHDTDRNSALIRAEHVAMAEQRLADSTDRAELAALHRRESAVLAVDAFTSGRWREAREWAQRGCAVSTRWPLAALSRLGGWVLGRGSGYTLARSESTPR